MRRHSFARCPLLGPALLCACSGGGGGGSGGGTGPTNLGLSAQGMQGRGELWVLEVSEHDEGLADRNGDGDADDVVLAVLDLADGSLTNLALAFAAPPSSLVVGDVLVAFGVPEAGQGGADLNGDGDADDVVLHVYDSNARAVTSTGLAMAALLPAIGAANVAFVVDEDAQGGQDLDGDGTTNGLVLHVHDSRTHQTTNAQRNVTSEITFHDHAFAHTTDEASAGLDLNGDGDQTDTSVYEQFDLVLGGMEEVPLAIRGRPLATGGDDWYLLVDEGQQGADLNGDLDTLDAVFHRVQPHVGTQQPLGLSSTGTFGSVASTFRVAFLFQEIDGLDHDGDGDTDDTSLALYDAVTGTIFESGLAVDTDAAPIFVDGRLAYAADEEDSNLDLNGDGDFADDVLELMVVDTGLSIGTGMAIEAPLASGGILLFARLEDEAGVDWNGDGDQSDVVEFIWDPVTALATSTGLASTGSGSANAESVLLVAVEGDEGEDLNEDGDLADLVYVLHDRATQVNASLGVAATVLDGELLEDGRAVLLVSESAQGRDLNGDGDDDDSVLHLLE